MNDTEDRFQEFVIPAESSQFQRIWNPARYLSVLEFPYSALSISTGSIAGRGRIAGTAANATAIRIVVRGTHNITGLIACTLPRLIPMPAIVPVAMVKTKRGKA